LKHPGKLNALGANMWRELEQAFSVLAAERSSLRCVVVRGADGNFAAGADISEFPVERNDAATVRFSCAPLWWCACMASVRLQLHCCCSDHTTFVSSRIATH